MKHSLSSVASLAAAGITQMALLPLPIAHAQESMLEEIIVTARKREQSLQDVSVAVTALPENILKDAKLMNSEDLVTLVPSLNLQKGGAPRATSFNIRGIGTQSFSSGIEPSVSTVVDGVVMGRSGMAFAQLLDVQRVEVLRGPQGTLFGKNASGGVVHIITKNPSEEFEAETSASALERGEYNFGFTLSSPITDTLGFRITGSVIEDQGYLYNEFNGNDVNKVKDWNVRGKLRWNPADTLELKWSSDINRRDTSCCLATIRSIEPFAGISDNDRALQLTALEEIMPVVPSEENTRVNVNGIEGRIDPVTGRYTGGKLDTDIDASGHSFEVNWDIGEHTLTSISAYRDWSQDRWEDPDGRPTNLLLEQIGFSESQQLTQEFRITSPADQFASYVLGLYYFDQDLKRDFERTLFPTDPAIAGTAFSDGDVDTLNYAAFGEVTFNISESLRFIAGGRFTRDEIDVQFFRDSDSPFQPAEQRFEKAVSEDDFSVKAAVEWNVTDTALTYFSYAQGYKGPAFNIIAGSTQENTDPVAPETADAFELGLKSSWWDNRLILNAALFYAEYQDFQAQSVETTPILDAAGNPVDRDMNGVNDTAFAFVLNNVGEVSTTGLEVDFIARPIEQLQLFGGFAILEAEIDSYLGGPCDFAQETRGVGFRGQTSCGAPAIPGEPRNQDLSGGDLPQSPDWKFTLAASYNIPLARLPFDVTLQGNYRIQDDVQYGIEQDEFTIQESYDVLDLSIQLRDKDEHYSVTAFVKNVLDEFYVTGIGANSGQIIPNNYIQQVPRTARRTAGIEFRYRWF